MTCRTCPKCHGDGMRYYRIPLPYRTLTQHLQDIADNVPTAFCTERRKCLDCDGTGALVVHETEVSA